MHFYLDYKLFGEGTICLLFVFTASSTMGYLSMMGLLGSLAILITKNNMDLYQHKICLLSRQVSMKLLSMVRIVSLMLFNLFHSWN